MESAFGVDHGEISKAMTNMNPMKAFKPKPMKPVKAAWKPAKPQTAGMQKPFAQALTKPAQPIMQTAANAQNTAMKPGMKPPKPGMK